MNWLVIGFWGCAAMWLISLAGDIGLARDERVAPGMQWLALISALLAFIGMCYFGAAARPIWLVVAGLAFTAPVATAPINCASC